MWSKFSMRTWRQNVWIYTDRFSLSSKRNRLKYHRVFPSQTSHERMNNVVQRGAHAERNCLGLLKKCYCDAAVVRGISDRRGCDWLKWLCCLGDGRGGTEALPCGVISALRGWRKQLLIFWHSASERLLHESTGALSSDATVECTNVSKRFSVRFIILFIWREILYISAFLIGWQV